MTIGLQRIALALLAMVVSPTLAAVDADLDPAFAGGQRTLGFDLPGESSADDVFALRRDRQGRYLVFMATRASAGGSLARIDLGLQRLLPDGTLDPAFGTGGKRVIALAATNLVDAVLDSQDRMLVVGAGQASADPASGFSIALRLLPDGQRDPGFAQNGLRVIDVNGLFDEARAVLVDAQDRVIVGAYGGNADVNQFFFLVRLLAGDGDGDSGWGAGGVALVQFDLLPRRQDLLTALAPAANGGVYAVGMAISQSSGGSQPSAARLAVARLTANGQLDPTFCSSAQCVAASPPGLNGGRRAIEVRTRGFSPLAPVPSAALESDGGLLIVGGDESDAEGEKSGWVLRMGADGLVDPAFGNPLSPGVREVEVFGGQAAATAIVRDGLGRLLVGGSLERDPAAPFTRSAFLMRLDANGAPDPSFESPASAIAEYDFGTPAGTIRARRALLHDGGRILAAARTSGADSDVALWAVGALDGLLKDGFENP